MSFSIGENTIATRPFLGDYFLKQFFGKFRLMRHSTHYLLRKSHWLIFVLGFAISTWAAIYVDAQIERKAQDSFVLKVQDMEAAIVKRLRSYEDILFSIAGLYQAFDKVTAMQFDLYSQSLNMKERFPSLTAINFAQYVTHAERDDFVRKFHDDTDGKNKAARLDLIDGREEYMVITRIYPVETTSSLGIDVLNNKIRQTPSYLPLEQSTLRSENYFSNKVFSSGIPIAPLGTKTLAIAARLGILKLDKHNVPKLIGSAGIGFKIPIFFREAVPEKLAKTLHYKMENIGKLDGTKYNPPIPVVDSCSIGTGINPDHFLSHDLLKKHFDIPFGGTIFRINVTERRDVSISKYEKFLPVGVFLGGILFFSGISISSRRMLSDNAALDAAVHKRTIELQCEINRTRGLERELAVVIESERTRIGGELHDDLGQRLTAISVSAEILSSKLRVIDTTLAAQADELGQATSEAMMQVRTLAHGLMPVASSPEGLREALTHLAAGISRLSGIQCTFDFDDPIDIMDEGVSAHLYRIVQEAVNNAIRHAEASSIDIRLDEQGGKVMLSVRDDGCGFNNQDPKFRSGLGLNTITYRASLIHYDLEILSSPGTGTVIRVTET